jgi:flagellar hook assembly protein FlgD
MEFGSDVFYFPADYATNPIITEVMAAISLFVQPKTFLPAFETFPIVITYPSDHEAVLRILDMEGRVVRTLFDSRFNQTDAPINRVEFDWDGRSDVFELVKAGTYIVHLQAVNEQTGERENKTAPAVVATRLSR